MASGPERVPATQELAALAVHTDSRALPPEVIHAARRLVLDGIGCALGALALAESRIPRDVLGNIGGAPEATVIGSQKRLPIALAAYVNAKLGNLMDADDVFYNIGHPSPVVLFPALAAAERQGTSGRDFLAAFALGFEVASRVVLGVGSIFELVDGKAIPSDTTGFGHAIFGGAAAVGRLLGLDQAGMENALGIAGLHCPAPLSHKSITDASMSKYQLEWAAAGACLAALLAHGGQRGPRTILDDHFFARAMSRRQLNHRLMRADLGRRWHILETSIKPYPHCRHTHYALDALGALLARHHLRPDEVEAVRIRGLSNYTVHPWNVRRPADPYQAQFSLPYAVAMVLLGVEPGPAWLAPERISDPAVHALAARVEAEDDPDIVREVARRLPEPLTEVPTTVTVVARGREYVESVRTARGDGFAPTQLSDDEVLHKFRVNAGAVLPPQQVEALARAVWDLDAAPDVTTITRLLGIPDER